MTIDRAHEFIRTHCSTSLPRARRALAISAFLTFFAAIGCVPTDTAPIGGGAGQSIPSAQQRVVVVSTAPNQTSGAALGSQAVESRNKSNGAAPDTQTQDSDSPTTTRPGAPIAAARMLATGGSNARRTPVGGAGQTALTPTISKTLPANSAETTKKVDGAGQSAQLGANVPVPPAAPIASEARPERLPRQSSMIIPPPAGVMIRNVSQNASGYLRPDSISSGQPNGRSPVFVVAPDGSAQGQNGTRSPNPQNAKGAATTGGNLQNPPQVLGPAGSP